MLSNVLFQYILLLAQGLSLNCAYNCKVVPNPQSMECHYACSTHLNTKIYRNKFFPSQILNVLLWIEQTLKKVPKLAWYHFFQIKTYFYFNFSVQQLCEWVGI